MYYLFKLNFKTMQTANAQAATTAAKEVTINHNPDPNRDYYYPFIIRVNGKQYSEHKTLRSARVMRTKLQNAAARC